MSSCHLYRSSIYERLYIIDGKITAKRKNSVISVEITKEEARTLLEAECRDATF